MHTLGITLFIAMTCIGCGELPFLADVDPFDSFDTDFVGKADVDLIEPIGDDGDIAGLPWFRPHDFAVYTPGDPNSNTVSVYMLGRVVDRRANPGLRVRWSTDAGRSWSSWTPVDTYEPANGNWELTTDISGRGRVFLQVETQNGPPLRTTRRDFAIGPTVLILGQSNAAGHAEMVYRPAAGGDLRTGDVPRQIGERNEFGKMFIELWARQPHVVCGMAKRAAGGTSIDAWQPGTTNFIGATERANALETEWGGVDFAIWRQGESDAAAAMPTSEYKAKLEAIIDSLSPPPRAWLLTLQHDIFAVPDANEESIREAMRQIATERSNVYLSDLSSIQDDYTINPSHLQLDATVSTAADVQATAFRNMMLAEGYP